MNLIFSYYKTFLKSLEKRKVKKSSFTSYKNSSRSSSSITRKAISYKVSSKASENFRKLNIRHDNSKITLTFPEILRLNSTGNTEDGGVFHRTEHLFRWKCLKKKILATSSPLLRKGKNSAFR